MFMLFRLDSLSVLSVLISLLLVKEVLNHDQVALVWSVIFLVVGITDSVFSLSALGYVCVVTQIANYTKIYIFTIMFL